MLDDDDERNNDRLDVLRIISFLDFLPLPYALLILLLVFIIRFDDPPLVVLVDDEDALFVVFAADAATELAAVVPTADASLEG